MVYATEAMAGASESSNDAEGIVCPKCGCRHMNVSYGRKQLGFVQRVKYCRNCGQRVLTREAIVRLLPEARQNRSTDRTNDGA